MQHNASITHTQPHLDKQLYTSHLYSEIPRGLGPIFKFLDFVIDIGKQFEKTRTLDIKCHTKKRQRLDNSGIDLHATHNPSSTASFEANHMLCKDKKKTQIVYPKPPMIAYNKSEKKKHDSLVKAKLTTWRKLHV